ECGHARRVDIVDEEIGLPKQSLKDLLPAWGLEIECHATLIGIEIEKQATFFRVRNFPRIRAAPTRTITYNRMFDLNYLCPHIRDQLGRVGGRNHVAVFDDPEACKSASRHKSSFCLPSGQASAFLAQL